MLPVPQPVRTLVPAVVCAWLLANLPAAGTGPGGSAKDPSHPALDAALTDEGDLTDMSIEDLLDMDVTIASRRPQKLSQVPGAVYVLTGDEIRRAGHTSVQEALRMVPGFYVSRWQTSNTDVASRGFGPGLAYTNSAFINQLLVMLDGVVVYSPLFPGVWWALQDLDMAQIDRIEIIRGPGGLLWGANAVHGVVHIITKDARETLGPRVSSYASEDENHYAVSEGIPLGQKGALRLWGKRANYDALKGPFLGIDDAYAINSFGGRADWTDGGGNEWTAWSRAYDANVHEVAVDLTTFVPFRANTDKKGYLAHVERTNPENGSKWSASYVRDKQDRPTFFEFHIDTFDVDYKREVYKGEQLDIQTGGSWRHIQADFVGDDPTYFDFSSHNIGLNTFRAFSLATYHFSDPAWTFVGGASLEHNDLTDWEVQPTARLSFAPDDVSLAWAAISRAVRTPSLEEHFASQSGFLGGNPNFDSEKLVAYELGYRRNLKDRLSVDSAFFLNSEDDLRVEVFTPAGSVVTTNLGQATTWGAELGMDWKPFERWSVRTTYSFQKGHFSFKPTSQDLGTDRQSPKHAASVRSFLDLGKHWELDMAVYVVKGLAKQINSADYVRTDARIGWRPNKKLNLYVGLKGVTNGNYTEFSKDLGSRRSSAFFGFDWTP